MNNRNLPAIPLRKLGLTAFIVCAGLITFSKADNAAQSAVYTEKVAGTPHFYQCDPRGGFREGGRTYCGPTAVSDSLMYLAAHGFPRLLPAGSADPFVSQAQMIEMISSSTFLKTDPARGTGAENVCSGIEDYVQSSGYVCKKLEYRGWQTFRGVKGVYASGLMPTLDWIKRGIADPHGAVWVNVGWYVHSGPGECKRVGGHWLAATGYGIDGDGREDPDILLVDNPAVPFADGQWSTPNPGIPTDLAQRPSRAEVAAEVMMAEPVGPGQLVGNYNGLPRDAEGMYFVYGEGVSMSEKYDAAFLDGAIVFVIGDRHH